VTHTHTSLTLREPLKTWGSLTLGLSYTLNEIMSILPHVRLEPPEALSLATEFKMIGEQLERLARELAREGEASQGDDAESADGLEEGGD